MNELDGGTNWTREVPNSFLPPKGILHAVTLFVARATKMTTAGNPYRSKQPCTVEILGFQFGLYHACRCPVTLSTEYQPFVIVFYSFYFWLIRYFTDPT